MLSRKYHSGILFPQQRRLFLTMGAHHSLDPWVEHARDFDHSTRPKRIGGCNHQHMSPRNMRLNKDGRVRGVARDGMDSTFAQGLDQLMMPTAAAITHSVNSSRPPGQALPSTIKP